MTAAAVLAEGVLAARGAAGRDRVAAVSSALEDLDELEVR